MKSLDPLALSEKTISQIRKGAFLTVKSGEKQNTMTIGWATIGFVWQRTILMVAVRKTRHTFDLIETAKDFTVSVPLDDKWKNAINFCGTKSGRDFDKFKECGLDTMTSRQVISPIIQMDGLHFECNIILKAPLDPAFMHPDLEKIYPLHDYHTLYFGEVKECYELDGR